MQVVAVCLLLVVVVVSITNFESWFSTAQSSLIVDVEENSKFIDLRFDGYSEGALNIYSSDDILVDIVKIFQNGGVLCEYKREDILERNLIVDYDFENYNSTHVFDKSLYAIDGEYTNDVTCGVPGKVGLACDLNSSDPRIDVDQPFNDSITDISISFWLYPRTSNMQIVNHESNKFYLNTVGGGGFYLRNQSNDGSGYLAWINEPQVNQWTQVVATFDGTSMSIYSNGSLDSSQDFQHNIFSDVLNSAYIIGSSGTNDFDGLIDSFQIYDHSFSQTEILNQYYFGTNVLKINSGLNEIDISNCNLESKNLYEIILFAGETKFSSEFFVKY